MLLSAFRFSLRVRRMWPTLDCTAVDATSYLATPTFTPLGCHSPIPPSLTNSPTYCTADDMAGKACRAPALGRSAGRSGVLAVETT